MQKPPRFPAGVFCFLFLAFTSGCATAPVILNREEMADHIAQKAGLEKLSLKTDPFLLTAYARVASRGEPLVVYIEGDGLAWESRRIISDDPTPLHPVMLKLAGMDPSPNVAYLARPCQYSTDDACGYAYWTGKRFSEPVIHSMDQAVSDLEGWAGSQQVHLVGYSGGGAVAVLVAARRDDVLSVRTIAGNLDPQGLNDHFKVSPLAGSLDPMKEAKRVATIPQRHFIGTQDKMVPGFVVQNYIRASGSDACIEVTRVSGAEHAKGWVDEWPRLVKLPTGCLSAQGLLAAAERARDKE